MPVPPKQLKNLIEGTVDHHASTALPGLQEVTIRWRGSYGYLTAWAGEGNDDDEQIPLCRIEYLGDDDDWGGHLRPRHRDLHRRSPAHRGLRREPHRCLRHRHHLAEYQQ